MTPYYETDHGILYHGKWEEVYQEIDDDSIDIVITSPPYNIKGGNLHEGGTWPMADLRFGYDEFKDDIPHHEYVHQQTEFLHKTWNKLTRDGAIFYNHKPRQKDGELWTPLEFIPHDTYLILRQIITWYRMSGHNYCPRHYCPMYEWICLFAKKTFSLKSRSISKIGDVWPMPPATNNKHPAPFPIELPMNIIKTVHESNDIYMDPYMGSGTVAFVCERMGKYWIGIEQSEKYCEWIVKGLEEIALGFDPFKPQGLITTEGGLFDAI